MICRGRLLAWLGSILIVRIAVARPPLVVTRVVVADIGRALEMAQAISIPQGRQIVHLIPRRYKIDDNDEVKNPLGLFGYRLEVEAHIVTVAVAALQNLSLCTENVGITTDEFVLNALASGQAVLEPSERDMGVLLADMGGGTTEYRPLHGRHGLAHRRFTHWRQPYHQRHRHWSASTF